MKYLIKIHCFVKGVLPYTVSLVLALCLYNTIQIHKSKSEVEKTSLSISGDINGNRRVLKRIASAVGVSVKSDFYNDFEGDDAFDVDDDIFD